jgi:phage-related tail fiber protein
MPTPNFFALVTNAGDSKVADAIANGTNPEHLADGVR